MIEIVEKLIGRFRGRGGSENEIILGRVPKEERNILWGADPDEMLDAIHKVNKMLVEKGQLPLNEREEEDAYQGNWTKHLKRTSNKRGVS